MAGCSGDEGKGGDAAANACLSNRHYFESQVWASFMSQKCARCHTPDGEAVNEKGAKLVLQTASYPGFLDANLATLGQISKEQFDGKSKLLLKPIGSLEHGGGQIIAPDGPEHKALQELVRRFQSGDPCPDTTVASVDGVQMLSAAALLRKATIDLGGRLPTPQEEQSVSVEGAAAEQALDAALDALMREQVFETRLREIYNDLLLTDLFFDYGGRMIDNMDSGVYPALEPYKNGDKPEYKSATRGMINAALTREPLDLIVHVARNDRPFTEILTANYAVVTPASAIAYGLDGSVQFDPNNPYDLKEVQVTSHHKEGDGDSAKWVPAPVPHAGLLSTPAFLNRWTTSPTNRNRGRARRVYQFFLATDILKLAERPVDPSAVTAEENPTMRSKFCTMCHKVMDPVAGSFRGYDDRNYEYFDAARPWHEDMEAPGYSGTKLPPEAYGAGLPWLAQQITQDPRFVISVINTVYTGLTGHEPLAYPTDSVGSPGHDQRVAAWSAQEAFFRQLGEEFKAKGYNVKVVFKGILKSPYYRAETLATDPAERKAIYESVGTGRWLTPEMLNRKITAVMGIPWRHYWEWGDIMKDKAEGKDLRLDRGQWLVREDDYKLLYGGIDSDNVPVRLKDPNGISASVAWRMANEMACHTTAWDFWKPKDQRRFFPLVDAKDRPEYNGKPVAESQKLIRDNLVHLHRLILGETLAPDSPEIERSFGLFLETWREWAANEDQKDKKEDLIWECQARYDFDNLAVIPEEQQLRKDKDYTIRAWMAVITYLMLDYRFLYH